MGFMRRSALSFFTIFFLCFHASFAQNKKTILFLGDSLSSGYGVSEEASFFYQIKKKLSAKNSHWNFINISQPGSTSSTGYERLQFQLKRRDADVLFLELGGNDALREYDSETLKKNLLKTIDEAKKKKMKVILVGLSLPVNYERRFRTAYEEAFKAASKNADIYVPSLLSVLKDRKYFQDDYIHPNEEGHKLLAEYLMPYVERSLQ